MTDIQFVDKQYSILCPALDSSREYKSNKSLINNIYSVVTVS